MRDPFPNSSLAVCAKFRPLASPGTPWHHSKILHRCDTRRHCRSGNQQKWHRRLVLSLHDRCRQRRHSQSCLAPNGKAHRRGGLAGRHDHYGTQLRQRAAVSRGVSSVGWSRCWAVLPFLLCLKSYNLSSQATDNPISVFRS
jgi:hypothetical protein